jgi:hypothetical protein
MIPYNVNTKEYSSSDEYVAIFAHLNQIAKTRADTLAINYPTYQIKHRASAERSMDYHMTAHNVPFYDIICETLLHKDGNGYLDVVEFTYQLNLFAKTIFHRKLWGDQLAQTPDKFLYFVWNNYKTKQLDCDFDRLESVSNSMLANYDLLEYHRRFITNDTYELIALEEARDLFDQLVDRKVFDNSIGDLYQVYSGVPFDEVNTDAKTIFHSGSITKMDQLHLSSKFKVETRPALMSIDSKFNFIPKDDPEGMFEGLIVNLKLGNKVRFLPQFLVFYN